MNERNQALLEEELAKAELLAALRHALDFRYRRLCRQARADWERLFGKDPADSCVTVRVEVLPSTAICGSGFLKSRRPLSKSTAKSPVAHFAH